MRILTFIVIFAAIGAVLASQEPQPVKVYCFSADLEAGFKDDVAAYVCKELGGRGKKKKSLILVENRPDANVLVEFLGIEHWSERGEASYINTGYVWTPDQTKTGARLLLSIGEFNKGFHAAGMGGQATAGVAWKTEEWIRENREVILQKAKQK